MTLITKEQVSPFVEQFKEITATLQAL